MKKIYTILYLILICNFTMMGQDQFDFVDTSEWKSLEKDKYTVKYPETWSLQKGGYPGIEFLLMAPVSSADDNFAENVNFLTQDLKGMDLNIDTYLELTLSQIGTLIENGNLISSERIQIKGRECHKLKYTGTQQSHELTFEQIFWIIDDVANIITLTTLSDSYEEYKNIGNAIFESFLLRY